MDETHRFQIDNEAAGTRLDAWLTDQLDGVSRARVGKAIEEGLVTIGGACPKKAGVKLRDGDEIVITIRAPPPLKAAAQELPLPLVYVDDQVVVVNKPAGMVVHPSAGHPDRTLVNALLHHVKTLSAGSAPERPGIVHRLDKDTSGVLVVARTPVAHTHLAAQFAQHTVTRRYIAVVHGARIEDEGVHETLYGRDPRHRLKMSAQVSEGKRACTHWRTLARSRAFALVECRLETGRTHQIRVHMAQSGHPVVSDELYGRKPSRDAGPLSSEMGAARRMPRQALHAQTLAFDHPASGERPGFSSGLPEDMLTLVGALFGDEVAGEFR